MFFFILFAMQSYVGKLAEYPHPVASSISSRIMAEFGMVTALLAAAAAVVAGFMASAAFAMTSFFYAATVYVLWPLARPFLKLALGIVSNIAEGIWECIIDIYSDGGFFSKIYELYTFGGVSASIEVLKPILLVFITMVLLVRFTLSRRPKNFRKWVLLSFLLNFLNLLAKFTWLVHYCMVLCIFKPLIMLQTFFPYRIFGKA